ncbi:flavin reductase family protein [Pediococcus inopinatus]|uniref:flavin reductase family protein n=1 Tax=Pediococcus inopinatus TaxID=114090 RepID=UPI002A69B75A|nr:flavin reductase family protein [Pediococcus inopinatus]WPC17756.1 flavin reductase family protein [Pediococcus inopinatus]WPP10073.1 flavin reductase family protein [Pediococcus inopinatus]
MISINSQDLAAKEAYKLISGSVIPRPIAWITTYNRDKSVINLAPFSFFSGVAGKEPLVSVSILRKEDGSVKDTARNLIDTKEAVVHVVSEGLVHKMNQTAASLDAKETELADTNLETVESKLVAVPGLQAAKVRFEVQVYQYVPIKDAHDQIITDMFILKVVEMYFDETILNQEKNYIDAKALKPVARLAGPQYANLGKTYRITRPK